MRRNILGISQGAASIVALAATAIIVTFALSAQLPNLYFVQAAGSQEAGKAEKLAGVRLSIVAVLEDGTAIIANDGPDPVTIDKLYTPSGVVRLTSPITVQPGQKISLQLGSQPDALAAGLPDGRKVVLKEKPGVQIATLTSSVNPTSSTRITTSYRTTTTYHTTTTTYTTTVTTTVFPTHTVTSHVTRDFTTYTPFTATYWQARSTRITTVTTLYTYIRHQYGYYGCYWYAEYWYTYTYWIYQNRIISSTMATTTSTATVQVRVATTTSLDTVAIPRTMYYITSIITTSPSPIQTVTSTATYTEISYIPHYTYSEWRWSDQWYGSCYHYYYSYSTSTIPATMTAASPTVVLTTTTVS
jgi:hypothetical protein